MRRLLLILFLIISSLLNTGHSFAQSLPPLLTAIKNNDTAQVKALLKSRVVVSVVDDDSDNVLMYAALYSTTTCMQLLLDKGADPNATNKLGETAIMWCTHDIGKTKLLLNYKAGVNIKTTTGNTAFLSACVGNAPAEMIALMLQYGADPLMKNNNNQTSLIRTAIYGDTATARLLLNRGVNIDEQDGAHSTALLYAIRSVNKDMVLWLLANGADAKIADDYKASPLLYAVITNNIDIVKALIPKTNDLQQQDSEGTTILMWATYNEYDNPAIVQLLLDAGAGASLPLKDMKGETALVWAKKKGNTATVALLKKAGAVY